MAHIKLSLLPISSFSSVKLQFHSDQFCFPLPFLSFCSQIENESILLQGGSLINLCGVTLLWRTSSALYSTPSLKQLEELRQELNVAYWPFTPWHSAILCTKSSRGCTFTVDMCMSTTAGDRSGLQAIQVATVPLRAPVAVLQDPPSHAFCPCGHVCSEKTAQGWSQIPLPHGTHAFYTTCPFCGSRPTGKQAYVRLIFQGPMDLGQQGPWVVGGVGGNHT